MGGAATTPLMVVRRGIEPQIHYLQQVPYVATAFDYGRTLVNGLFLLSEYQQTGGPGKGFLEGRAVLSTLQYAIQEKWCLLRSGRL